MRYGRLLVPIMTVLCAAACAPPSPSPGQLQPFSNACAKSNEGQLIAVDGYLRLPDSLDGGSSVDLRLYPDLTFQSRPIEVVMPVGDGPNHAQRITSPYHDDDLKVHLADGTPVPFGTRLRVSGRVFYPIVPQDFECGLTNVYLEPSK